MRGGKREGAGRKAKDETGPRSVTIAFRPSAAILARLETEVADGRAKSLGEAVQKALEQLFLSGEAP